MRYAVRDPIVSADFPKRQYKMEEKNQLLKYMSLYENGILSLNPLTDHVKNEMLLGTNNLCHDDGEYAWTDEEIYHIKKYDAAVTDEFIQHVIRFNVRWNPVSCQNKNTD